MRCDQETGHLAGILLSVRVEPQHAAAHQIHHQNVAPVGAQQRLGTDVVARLNTELNAGKRRQRNAQRPAHQQCHAE